MNYINKNYIEIEKLINDLVVFKTYKDKIELEMADFQFLISILAICATIFTSLLNGIPSSHDKFPYIKGLYLFMYALYIFMLYIIDRVPRKTKFNKLKTIDNVIYTLEAIKENLVEVPEIFDVEVKNLIDEKAEPRRYSVKVRESLERKSK